MDTIFKFLFEFLKQFFGSIFKGIVDILQAFNFKAYYDIIQNFTGQGELGKGVAWVIAIVAMLLLAAVLGLIIFFIVKGIMKFTKFKKKAKDTNDLVNEVNALNKEVMRLNLEKDKILSMKVSQIGLNPNEISELTGEELEALNKEEEEEEVSTGRFNKLVTIDEEWADYQPEPYDWDVTLPEFVTNFRNFACSRMHYWYEIKLLRCFVAGFASGRLTILQGISGTGKTSLPYAFGKYVCNPAVIASVQPSWRDRTELFGYYNEFTKRYNETELLRALYEASYNENVYVVILDEMNIARVEYYFAEMLSILEMPAHDEWIVEIVAAPWPDDPKHLDHGKLTIPDNIWYVGTANNDDSTFAITDKVYDRAMPIDINTKGKPFEAPDTPPCHINYKHFTKLLEDAVAANPISEENLKKIEILDDYVIEHFRVAFGNRVMKQINSFVPAFVGCGGTEIDGIDYALCKKVFRKFEALNISYIRDEIDGLVQQLDQLFGRENMNECKEYVRMLQKMT